MQPYRNLRDQAFWKTGVVQQKPESVDGMYLKRFQITPEDRIATAGSCFAQHIAKRLRSSGYSVLDMEPAPKGLDDAAKAKYGYGLYSARYGNIYTVRQLLQLLEECRGKFQPDNSTWPYRGRWIDALRPGVEPDGLSSPEIVRELRLDHLRHVRGMIKRTNIFIFTFGLTEAWTSRVNGTVYPMAPGTMGGEYDPDVHELHNFTYEETLADFLKVRAIFRRSNPNIRFLLTVSPVPLAATATTQHVLPATVRSKSVLRAVAAALYERYDDIDYFPSYELIASSFSEGRFYEDDRRNVTSDGVDAVMRMFFSQHPPVEMTRRPSPRGKEWTVCEEAMLGSFQ